MGTFLGVPIIRTIVFWGLYWGPLILGNYHMETAQITSSYSAPMREGFDFCFAEGIQGCLGNPAADD